MKMPKYDEVAVKTDGDAEAKKNAATTTALEEAARDTLQKLAAAYTSKRRSDFLHLLSDDFPNEMMLDEALTQDFRNYSSVNLSLTPNTTSVNGETISVQFNYNLGLISNRGTNSNFSGQTEYVFRWEQGKARLYKMGSPIIFGNSLPAEQSLIARSQGTPSSSGSSAPGNDTLRYGSGQVSTDLGFNFQQGVTVSTTSSSADIFVDSTGDVVGDIQDIGPCDLQTVGTVPAYPHGGGDNISVGNCYAVLAKSPPGFYVVALVTSIEIDASGTFNYVYQANGSNQFH